MCLTLATYVLIKALTSSSKLSINVNHVGQIDVTSRIGKLRLTGEEEAVAVPVLEVELVQLDADLISDLGVVLSNGDHRSIVRIVKN